MQSGRRFHVISLPVQCRKTLFDLVVLQDLFG
jgi:hypothetical protein